LPALEDVLELAPVELFEALVEPDELDKPDEPDEPDEAELLVEAVVGLKLMLPAPNPTFDA
jgi:hypothetical protein